MNKFVIGLLLGSISAVKINQALPDYWDGNYSNTWKYTDRDHIVNETAWLEGNPWGYSQAVFGDGSPGGANRTDGYDDLQTGAKTLVMMEDANLAAPDYNRVDAWNDEQHNHSHEKEWKEETAKLTAGGYNVAAQQKLYQLMQREKKDEEAFQANEHYRKNYIMARERGYTESQAKNFARLEKESETGETNQIYNFPSSGPATYAQRFSDNQFIQTPDTPNDYNRADAWNDDQATHYNEGEYEAETANPAGYQVTLGA